MYLCSNCSLTVAGLLANALTNLTGRLVPICPGGIKICLLGQVKFDPLMVLIPETHHYSLASVLLEDGA